MRDYRIVGNADDDRKQAIKEDLRDSAKKDKFIGYSEETKERIQRLEYKKHEGMLEIISSVNEESNKIMVEAGLDPIHIPPDNIHILPDELFLDFESDFFAKADNKDTVASADPISQSIFLSAEKTRILSATELAVIIFHEMLHVKAHLSLEVGKKESGREEITPYREGMRIKALQKNTDEDLYYTYFKGIDEAIVSSQEQKLLANLGSYKVFEDDVKWMNSKETRKLKTELAELHGEPEEEIHWIERDGGPIALGGYQKYRKVLGYVLEQIKEQFSDTYKSTNDVEKEFLRSHFTGHLLGVGKLVERTFGKGAFRILGRMRTQDDTEEFSAKNILDELQSMRTGIKSNL